MILDLIDAGRGGALSWQLKPTILGSPRPRQLYIPNISGNCPLHLIVPEPS